MKRFTKTVKEQFVGKSKTEAMEMLKEMAEEYEIKAIDYFESDHKVPKVIYVNYGAKAGMYFDKTSRRIVEVW